jgi:hypothetical protein
MDQNLCRSSLSCPKFDRSLLATAAAAPAPFDFVYSEVLGRKQMAIAASVGYGGELTNAITGKAHHLSLGCFKARPRYHEFRVEDWRGKPLIGSRFQSPLIEPDRRISRIKWARAHLVRNVAPPKMWRSVRAGLSL